MKLLQKRLSRDSPPLAKQLMTSFSVPTGRRPELVEKLMDAAKDAADANDSTKASNLRVVYHRALHRLGPEDAAVRVAATRCGRWIADDQTLILGIEMVTPTVYPLLERRHQDKVALALIDGRVRVASRMAVRSGAILEGATARLLPALSDERRHELLDTLLSRLAGGWTPRLMPRGSRVASRRTSQNPKLSASLTRLSERCLKTVRSTLPTKSMALLSIYRRASLTSSIKSCWVPTA